MKNLLRLKLNYFSEEATTETADTTQAETTVDTVADGEQEQEIPKFTQKDLDKAIQDRLKREKAKQPPKEKLDAFAKWEQSQQTEAEKQIETLKQFEALKTEKTNLEIKNRLLEEGIPKDLIKYAMLDISEAGDIETGISQFKASDIFKSKQSSVNFGARSQTTDTNNTSSKSVTELMAEANQHPERLPRILQQIEAMKK